MKTRSIACDELRAELANDAEADGPELGTHLARCPACRAFAADARRMQAIAADLGKPDLSLLAQRPQQARGGIGPLRGAMAAGLILGFLAAAIFAVVDQGPPATPGRAAARSTSMVADAGARFSPPRPSRPQVALFALFDQARTIVEERSGAVHWSGADPSAVVTAPSNGSRGLVALALAGRLDELIGHTSPPSPPALERGSAARSRP